MQKIVFPSKNEWGKILERPALDTFSLENIVNNILRKVKEGGDQALREFSLQFDKALLTELRVDNKEIIDAESTVSPDLKTAIGVAKKNIEAFHSSQLIREKVVETAPGINCWRKSVAIDKVGLYIPGGTAPLFSTVLMLGIPAKLAGCREIILCSPPDTDGGLHPAILYAAGLVGITKIFRMGGVQAIAAMAYGTESIPRVSKIFGPGNQYVMCAKQLVQKDGIAIDMPAGPSELAIYADESANPAFVAADLLSQAEHGVDSQVLLVSCSDIFAGNVLREMERQLEKLPRKQIARRVLTESRIILVNDENEAIDLLNEYAAEHLILSCKNADQLAEKVVNAGSVFIGNYSPESAGDYASGTNHTLPTKGYAKSYSGVSVDSFVKKISFQRISEEGLREIARTVIVMAEAEGLQAHANAVKIRLQKDS
jgi:histidinol dehydrogenase